ncbi:unnamed protein product [Auanema sp. JU1783]|nr:unnamed protein product [Auanema sp. JU1783]
MSADAQPNPKQRSTIEKHPKPPFNPKELKCEPVKCVAQQKAAIGTQCVVCGDRACSHLYYGVAACHGCKCFFWRTVKSHLTYTCRYNGNCSISTAGRNACRFCRFTRCLNSGMKLEAVRMDKKDDKKPKRKKEEENDENKNDSPYNDQPDLKRVRMDNRLFVSSLLLVDRTSRDGGDQQTSPYPVALEKAIQHPEMLNSDRFPMEYNMGAAADMIACGESERRLVIWALDWIRQAADIKEEDSISATDKVCLLRAACSPLLLLELANASCNTMETALPLPNNTYLYKDSQLPKNCFLNTRLTSSILSWANKHLRMMNLSPKELVLLKALIVFNPDSEDLSPMASENVAELRSLVQSCLFQICVDHVGMEQGAKRICSILLLVPQIQVMAVELIEHIRMRNTFAPTLADPLVSELYGDIFDNDAKDDQSMNSSSCSPSTNSVDST